MKIIRRLKLENESVIRDFSKPWPPEGFCPLCGKKNNICQCEKLDCQCGIKAINCKWPECICKDCLEINCECKDDK